MSCDICSCALMSHSFAMPPLGLSLEQELSVQWEHKGLQQLTCSLLRSHFWQ